MAAIVKEFKYEDTEDFIKSISFGGELYDILNEKCIFRGLLSHEYDLVPSALRQENEDYLWKLSGVKGPKLQLEITQIDVEQIILYKFYERCDYNCLYIPNSDRIRESQVNEIYKIQSMNTPEKWIPSDLYEIAALAQHYGLPTRLLDWSRDMFVSLYFAVNGFINSSLKSDYIVLWALNIDDINFYINDGMPLKLINPPYFANPNLGAQKGIFTLWEIMKPIKNVSPIIVDIDVKVDRRSLDLLIEDYMITHNKLNDNPFMYKILVSTDNICCLHDYLQKLKYDASKIFPGYNGVVKSIIEDSKFKD